MSRGASPLRPVWAACVRFWNGQGSTAKVAVALVGLVVLSCSGCRQPAMGGGPAPPTAAVSPDATAVTLAESPAGPSVPPSTTPTPALSATQQVTPTSPTAPPTGTPAPPPDTPVSSTAAPAPTEASTGSVPVEVVEVVDGDTIKVSFGGRVYTVRYIGIDTPETVHPERPVEWMGPEASAKNAELVAGRVVTLEKDVSETDRYGRLLRYVYVGDLMVNAELVRLGYAQVSTFPPDVKYQDLFLRLEAEARDADRGLWGPRPTPTARPAEVSTPQQSGREGCDPAYPDVCIPPPPPDLDCGDIPYRNFRVLTPDPHRFDGGNDGIGCER